MNLYAGLDFHSSNTYIGVLDQQFNCNFKKRVSNDLDLISSACNRCWRAAAAKESVPINCER